MIDENAARGNNDRNDASGRSANDGNAKRGGDAGRSGGADRTAGGNAERKAGAGTGDRNTSVEPPPALSDKGGIVPQEENPSEYNDRTRDRDLNEG